MKKIIIYPFCKIFDSLIRAKAFPILLYHSISDTPSRLAVPVNDFAAQIDWLAGQGYKTISPADLLTDNVDGEKRVLITFDDGFQDNLANGLPILEQHGFTATVFSSTDYIGQSSSFCHAPGDREFKMLSAAELGELKRNNWTIASHFASHRDLDELSAAEIREEYERASAALAEITGELTVGAIVSYPHNRYNGQVIEFLKQAGVRLAFSGRISFFAPDYDAYQIPRVEIDRTVNLGKFKLFLSPSYSWLKRKVYQREVKTVAA